MFLAYLASQALSGSREIDVNIGILGTDDENWGTFSEAQSLTSFGGRVGYPVMPHLKLLGGYEYGASGMTVYVEDDVGDDGSTAAFKTGFYAHQALLGAKAHWEPSKWVSVYGVLEADALFATVRIDDDPDDDENAGQVERGGMTGGGIVALGAEALVPMKNDRAWAFHLEVGYGLLAPLQVEDVASVQFSGASVRLGTGYRF